MDLGLASLQDEIPDLVPVSIEEAFQAGLEGFALIENFDDDVASLEVMIVGLENLEMIQTTIEAHGVQPSFIEMVGEELSTIAPSILNVGDELDIEALKSELNIAQEGFAKKVYESIKAMIEKIITFIKEFFNKALKVKNANAALVKSIDKTKIDEAKLKSIKITGTSIAKFDNHITTLPKTPIVIAKLGDLVNHNVGMSIEEFLEKGNEIVKDISLLFEGSSSTVGKLGFTTGDSIISRAASCRQLITIGEALPKHMEGAKADLLKNLKGQNQSTKTNSREYIRILNSLVSTITKNILKVNVQELSMLKACKAASAK
jgi:hypothetical protein